MKDIKIETLQHFDSTANCYDKSHDGRFTQSMYQPILKELLKMPRGKLLDLGCGNGNMLVRLRNTRFELYGADLSSEMIKEAQCRLGLDASLMVADAENLPYEDSLFDILLCNASFHHYPNPRKALREMYRVLKPNGALLIGEGYAAWPLRAFINYSFRYSDSGDFHTYGQKELSTLLSESGFQSVEIKKIGFTKRLYVAHSSKLTIKTKRHTSPRIIF